LQPERWLLEPTSPATGRWKAPVRAKSASNNQEIWVEAGIAGGTRGTPTGGWATWSCEDGKSMLLVIDEINRVITVARFSPHLPKGDFVGTPANR
jgi:hypothetical protein